MTDPTFRNINRLFVVSFKNGDGDKYYIPLVEIKDFNGCMKNL